MRSYSVAVSAVAIGASQKWLDNVLSHFDVPGMTAQTRGVARRIPHATLVHLAVARELHTALAMGVREALQLASELLVTEGGVVPAGGHLRITCDRATLEGELAGRLRDALEFAPMPRRGRPVRPQHPTGHSG